MRARPSCLAVLFGALALAASFTATAVTHAADPERVASVGPARELPPPALFVPAEDPTRPDERLGVQAVDVQVTIAGRLAETRMTLTFANPTARRLAGELYVPLPEHATVSGYALDVGGKLVDGVVVPKDEARRIYEIEIRKGVDPGLAEWTRGNVFHTRLFPILPHGTRSAMVSWVAPLDEGAGGPSYSLPLSFATPIDAHVRIAVTPGSGTPADLRIGDTLKAAFDAHGVAEARAHTTLVGSLGVRLADADAHPVQVEQEPDGSVRFALQDRATPPPRTSGELPTRVRVVWDASLSRAKADHARELRLLERVLREGVAADGEVEVVVVRNAASAPKTFALPAGIGAAIAYLAAEPYDGGTQLARFDAGAAAHVDAVLVFSDGLATFGDDATPSFGAPTWVVSSTLESSPATLEQLARANGGAAFALGDDPASAHAEDDAVVAAFGKPVFSLLAARVTAGAVSELVPAASEPVVGASLIAGKLDTERATIEVTYGIAGHAPALTRTFEVRRADATPGTIVGRAWANAELAWLEQRATKNEAAISALGKAWGIVTPGTSLLVLETLDQYVEHDVRPPASLPEMRAAWDAQSAAATRAAKESDEARLADVASAWDEEIAAYDKTYDYPANFRVGGHTDKDAELAMGESMGMGAGSASFGAAGEVRVVEGIETADAVTKSGVEGGDAPAPEPTIELSPWDPQTPYLRALQAAAPAAWMGIYLAQRERFGTAPGFFVDVADFFIAHGRRDLGLEVLSNVAELRLDDPALLRILGHRLAQLGEADLAAATFDEVLRLRPEEPQSHRDLALVLAQRAGAPGAAAESAARVKADYRRALDLLADVVKQPWDRFERIEIIALIELNRLWPDAQKAGAGAFPLDARFVHAMPMDVRIVMTWDADQTDMDLHVIEPSGEEAFYSHAETTIGGRVSKDFTQGYGPEEYVLKKAMRGRYKVRANFFGERSVELAGPVTLQVDVYTHWGRPDEKHRAMTLRLAKAKEDFDVGVIDL